MEQGIFRSVNKKWRKEEKIMKKTYENPVAEKIVFDYTNTVAASGTKLFGTSDEPWCHTKQTECGTNQNKCKNA